MFLLQSKLLFFLISAALDDALAFNFSPFPELCINPKSLPINGQTRTFADIHIDGPLLNWENFEIEFAKSKIPKESQSNTKSIIIPGRVENEDYECVLPPLEINGDSSIPTDNNESVALLLHSLQEKAEPLKSRCLSIQGQFWTYEVCPKKHIRQYRKEASEDPFGLGKVAEKLIPDGARLFFNDVLPELLKMVSSEGKEIITDEYFLGRYLPGENPDKIVNGILVQSYVDGDRCMDLDATPPRQTEVYYECDMQSNVDHIIDVTEVSSCKYIIRVGTQRVCSVSLISTGQRSIICFPVKGSPTDQLLENSAIRKNIKKAATSASARKDFSLGNATERRALVLDLLKRALKNEQKGYSRDPQKVQQTNILDEWAKLAKTYENIRKKSQGSVVDGDNDEGDDQKSKNEDEVVDVEIIRL